VKLRRLVFLEVIFFVAVLISLVIILQIIPFLQPSKENTSIGLYNTKFYPKTPITITSGSSITLPFEYSSYDPAIIILELSFQTCDEPGYLKVYCNYRNIASIFVSTEAPPVVINLISVSGSDWVEPPTAMLGRNELLFESEPPNGYTGSFTYQITLRGSR